MKLFEFLYKEKAVAGDVGFELEVEGSNLPSRVSGWVVTRDGSLRGEGSREFVLAKPSSYVAFCNNLKILFEACARKGSNIVDTVRAGVHVHINIQKLNLVEVFNFITMSVLFENLLAEYCGKSRVGNHFCLRTVDAPYIIKVIMNAAQTANLSLLYSDVIRYSFMNLKSVLEHGSIEFRGMRSTTEIPVLKRWVKVLLALRKASIKYDNPKQLINSYKADPAGFIEDTLGSNIKMFEEFPIEGLVAQGLVNSQEIAFCRQWSDLLKVGEVSGTNPFAAAEVPKKLMRRGRESVPRNRFPDVYPDDVKFIPRNRTKRSRSSSNSVEFEWNAEGGVAVTGINTPAGPITVTTNPNFQ